MNALEKHLNKIEPALYVSFQQTKVEVELLLQKYSANFPDYTDHSIKHTFEVFKIASELLTEEEVASLQSDETYILSMACILHDVGMCIPEDKIKDVLKSDELITYRQAHPNLSAQEAIRDIHHTLSKRFIIAELELLKIPNKKYAYAIGIVAEGHRKVELGDFDIYESQYFAKDGRESACLPYLACILRIADELDVTNSRVPKLLTKYYMPNNEISIREWLKHVATSQRNYRDNIVIFEVDCSDQNIYAALQDQFDKIQNVINYCQKIIRAIPFIKGKHRQLNLSLVEIKYHFIGFDPKGIKFSFDVQNVVTAFIGEELYKDKLTSLREAVQNSIDSCRYKNKVLKEQYKPLIKILVGDEFIKIEDNGAGMDEFIVENFFGRLASSFYEQEKIKTQFEAIGQFGVGVFSYFLMSEYIDIETKTSTSPALKFRFDKDPKSYFHFYDRADRSEPGTTITMYLKKELVGKLTEGTIENYLRKIFKHVEIPFELNVLGNISSIIYKGFEIDYLKEIKDRLKLQNRRLVNELRIEQANIDDDDIEGNCGLIIGKDYLKTFAFESSNYDYEQFYNVGRYANSQVSITQKGVFVSNYPSSNLSLLIGDVNLKKKIKINIDRNQFKDEAQIYNFISRFEIEILKKIFSGLEKKYLNDKEKISLTRDFLRNYYRYPNYTSRYKMENEIKEKYSQFITDFLYVELNKDGKSHSAIQIKDLIKDYEEFILLSDREDASEVFDFFHKPIVVAEGWAYDGSYPLVSNIFSDLMGYERAILFHEDKGYQQFKKVRKVDETYLTNVAILDELVEESFYSAIKSSSKKLFLNIWLGKAPFPTADSDEAFINYNHSFVQFIFKNHSQILTNNEYSKIVSSAFSYMRELQDQQTISRLEIKKINEILKPLNNIERFKNITLADFT
jgi:molecular chaperone HtpG